MRHLPSSFHHRVFSLLDLVFSLRFFSFLWQIVSRYVRPRFCKVLIPKTRQQRRRDTEGEQFGSGKDFYKNYRSHGTVFSSFMRFEELLSRIFCFDRNFHLVKYSVIGGAYICILGFSEKWELVENRSRKLLPRCRGWRNTSTKYFYWESGGVLLHESFENTFPYSNNCLSESIL